MFYPSVASLTKQVNLPLAKRPLKTKGRLANLGLTSLVKEAIGVWRSWSHANYVAYTRVSRSLYNF